MHTVLVAFYQSKTYCRSDDLPRTKLLKVQTANMFYILCQMVYVVNVVDGLVFRVSRVRFRIIRIMVMMLD